MKQFGEETILAILLYNLNTSHKDVEKIIQHLSDDMFQNNALKILYQIFKDVYDVNKAIYPSEQFFRQYNQVVFLEDNTLSSIVGDIESYWSATPTIDYWIKKIQEEYFKRRYSLANTKETFKEVLKEEEKYSLKSTKEEIINDLDEYEKRKDTAIFTHYSSINRYIGSLQGGDMIILAGSTGSGKTCFMLNLIMGFAKQNKSIDVYSLEMPPYQLRQRIVCAEANIDAKKFRSFTLTDEDKKNYNNYVTNVFNTFKINIHKSQSVTIDEIKRKTLKSKSDIVFIDYLGLISDYSNKNTYEKYSDISREIKLLAMQSNKPIIALHQLNRAFQDREDKKPRTSDLRDSGKIEQDADMIWFVYRPSLFNQGNQNLNDMRFILAKNRHGETNKEIKLRFNGETQKIQDIGGIIND